MRCLRCSCLHRVQIVTRFLVANSWDTRNPGAPHHFLHASAHFSFASVFQSSYQNWNAAVAPFSLSLPWHPFSFHHSEKCLIMLLSTFNKKLHKLVHVIRIMITTIKMFKLLLHQIAKCIWGFTGFFICYIRPHLNCLNGIVLL